MHRWLARLRDFSVRLVATLLLLVLGFVPCAHAIGPASSPEPLPLITGPADDAPPLVFTVLAPHRAHGPPVGVLVIRASIAGQSVAVIVVVCNAGHSAWANIWGYCGGDPVNRMDPTGLWDTSTDKNLAISEGVPSVNPVVAFLTRIENNAVRGESIEELYNHMGGFGGTGRSAGQFMAILNQMNPGLNLSDMSVLITPGEAIRIRSTDGSLSAMASASEKALLADQVSAAASEMSHVSGVSEGTLGLTIAAGSEQMAEAAELKDTAAKLRGGWGWAGKPHEFVMRSIASVASTGKGTGDAIYRSDISTSQKVIGVASDFLTVAPGAGAVEGAFMRSLAKRSSLSALGGRVTHLNSAADELLETLGPARLNHADEFEEIIMKVEAAGGSVEYADMGRIGINVQRGNPGTIVLHPDSSISAVRHEFMHFTDDLANGMPGFGYYMANPQVRWGMELRAYGMEIRTALKVGDLRAARALKERALEERFKLLGAEGGKR